jgi:NAD dependent epimerase/dehydratase family enzyme
MLNESSSLGHDFLAQLCAQWENAASAPCASQGTTVAMLRTGIVMSAQGGALKRQLPLFRLGVGGPHLNGQSPVAEPDLSRRRGRAILWIIDHASVGTRQSDLPDAAHELFNSASTNWRKRCIVPAIVMRVPALVARGGLGSVS